VRGDNGPTGISDPWRSFLEPSNHEIPCLQGILAGDRHDSTVVLQPFVVGFPTQVKREKISKNSKFLSANSELLPLGRKLPSSRGKR